MRIRSLYIILLNVLLNYTHGKSSLLRGIENSIPCVPFIQSNKRNQNCFLRQASRRPVDRLDDETKKTRNPKIAQTAFRFYALIRLTGARLQSQTTLVLYLLSAHCDKTASAVLAGYPSAVSEPIEQMLFELRSNEFICSAYKAGNGS